MQIKIIALLLLSYTTNSFCQIAGTSEVSSVNNEIEVVNFEGLQGIFHHKNDTTYVINFWATWCKPCVQELPYFEQLGASFQNEKLKVILVSLDFPDLLKTRLIPYVNEHALKSEVILLNDPDANNWIPKVDPDWSGAIPATYIYKNDKHAFFEKSFDYQTLVREVKKNLAL